MEFRGRAALRCDCPCINHAAEIVDVDAIAATRPRVMDRTAAIELAATTDVDRSNCVVTVPSATVSDDVDAIAALRGFVTLATADALETAEISADRPI